MVWRSAEYKDFIRFKPCLACGEAGPNDPHHVALGKQSIASYPSDTHCVPLCRVCHHMQHQDLGLDENDLLKSIANSFTEWMEKQDE